MLKPNCKGNFFFLIKIETKIKLIKNWGKKTQNSAESETNIFGLGSNCVEANLKSISLDNYFLCIRMQFVHVIQTKRKKKLFNSTKNVYFFEISRQEENLLVLKIQNVKRNCQLEDMTIIC